jgi:hypothetical protein
MMPMTAMHPMTLRSDIEAEPGTIAIALAPAMTVTDIAAMLFSIAPPAGPLGMCLLDEL